LSQICPVLLKRRGDITESSFSLREIKSATQVQQFFLTLFGSFPTESLYFLPHVFFQRNLILPNLRVNFPQNLSQICPLLLKRRGDITGSSFSLWEIKSVTQVQQFFLTLFGSFPAESLYFLPPVFFPAKPHLTISESKLSPKVDSNLPTYLKETWGHHGK